MPRTTKTAESKAVKPVERQKVETIFWADQIAEEAIARVGNEPVICKCAASPSGAKHIGNLFDVMKAYIIYKAVVKKGHPAQFVFTNDDKDPLRTIPMKLPSLEGELVDATKFNEEFIKYAGHPYHTIPDPFGCCHSWAEHFTKVWLDGIYALIPEKELKVFSNEIMYGEGKFDPYIETIFRNIEKAREIISRFQSHITGDYIPFHVVCENCGKITTTVTGFDLDKKTVTYTCTGRELAGKYVIQGCGHIGETAWKNGKLAWRFETSSQMAMLKVTVEPFGKEHAEGTVPSATAITKELFHIEPPIFPIYEFLLINGEKMSARRGNVYIVQDMLDIIEPEILMYFYTKRSLKQRDLNLKSIYQLVDDFERVERIYWGIDQEQNEHDKINAVREYESAMPAIPKHMPLRIEYQFAAMVSQLAPDTEQALKMLKSSGHIKPDQHLGPEEIAQIARRLTLARKWVHRHAPEMAVKINDDLPKEISLALTAQQKLALQSLAETLAKETDQAKLYNSFYDISKQHNLPTKDFFRAAYQVLINKTSGPRLAPFILALGRQRVRAILGQIAV